jgi:hypothetical protein
MTTQSEQILEDDSVARLTATGYAKVDVTDETSILENLKARLEACNSFSMTAREFNRVLWKQHIRCHQFQQRGDLHRWRPVSFRAAFATLYSFEPPASTEFPSAFPSP